MTSSYTTNKHIEQPAHNDYVDTWEIPVNGNSAVIDTALGGTTSLSVTSHSGTTVLTYSQYQPLALAISGTLTADVTYQIPSGVGGFWIVTNSTTGAHNVVISSGGAGTSVTTVQGSSTILRSDGTNITQAINQSQISSAMAPVVAAATVAAAFNLIGASGGTIGSDLIVSGNFSATGTGAFGGALTLNEGANFAALSANGALILDGSRNAATLSPGTSGQAIVSTGTAWAAGTPAGTFTSGSALTLDPYAVSTTTTQAHGLGVQPIYVSVELVCKTAEYGYSIGDRIALTGSYLGDANLVSSGGYNLQWNATNIIVLTGPVTPTIVKKSDNTAAQITAANWKLIATPYKLN
jgi:hypothetical protein